MTPDTRECTGLIDVTTSMSALAATILVKLAAPIAMTNFFEIHETL